MPENDYLPPIRDLFDFFHRWPELRGRVIRLRESGALEPDVEAVIDWMIALIDRVGPDDLANPPPHH